MMGFFLRRYQEGFSFHDLRHASARTTLDTYGHTWPDADESTRSAVGAVIAERMDSSGKSTAVPLRSQGSESQR
jgi:hypothetical protein